MNLRALLLAGFGLGLTGLPLTARADLAPGITAALDVCTLPDPGFAERGAAIAAAGWRPLEEDERSTAAQAVAGGDLFRFWFQLADATPADRLTRLVSAAADREAMIGAADTRDLWFTLDDPRGWLVISAPAETFISCLLAADMTAADLAAALGATAETRQETGVTADYLIAPGGSQRNAPMLLRYDAETFGGLQTLPLLILPPSPVSE